MMANGKCSINASLPVNCWIPHPTSSPHTTDFMYGHLIFSLKKISKTSAYVHGAHTQAIAIKEAIATTFQFLLVSPSNGIGRELKIIITISSSTHSQLSTRATKHKKLQYSMLESPTYYIRGYDILYKRLPNTI